MKKKIFPEQDELVLCDVDRILGTTVFVKIPEYNKEGVVATSEVAPGRIRNIRDYVTTGKKIVCKVIRIDEKTGHIDLSLRRVSKKEKEDVLTAEARERDAFAMIKIATKEKSAEIVEKIKNEYGKLSEFLKNIGEIETAPFGLSEQEREGLVKMLKEKPPKKVFVKAFIKVRSDEPDGILQIKELLGNILKLYQDVKISYISAQNYSMVVTAQDYKAANRISEEVMKKIASEASRMHCKVEIPE